MSEILYDRPLTEKDSFIEDAIGSARQGVEFERKIVESYTGVLSSNPDKILEGVSFILEVSNLGYDTEGGRIIPRYQGGVDTDFNNREAMERELEMHTSKSVGLSAELAYREQWAGLLFDRKDDPLLDEISGEIRKQAERKRRLVYGRNQEMQLHLGPELTVDQLIETEGSLEGHRETIEKLEARHTDLMQMQWNKETLESLDIYDVLSCTHDSTNASIDGEHVAVTTIGGMVKAVIFRSEAALEVEKTILNLKEALISTVETGAPTEWYASNYAKIYPRYEHSSYTGDCMIEELEFGIRTYNCLKRAGLQSLGSLLERTEDELKNIPNFGPRCSDDVRETLNRLGLSLRSEEQ